MSKSYYEILDVDPDASKETIRDAYREKVKEHHPDQSDDPDANDKFRQIREAKETLLDEQARRQYDRRQERESASGNGQGESGESSEEWAREQRRRERQQQRNRQQQRRQQRQQRRQQRQQRRERRQRREQRQQSESTDSGTGGRSRDRAGRQTETRTREREETSSQERSRSANESIRERAREGVQWLRDAYAAPKRWVYANFRTMDTTKRYFAEKSRSPTVLRLATAIAMIATAMQLTVGQNLSVTTELAIVIGGVVTSYLLYAVVSPLPFEAARSRGRFKPAGRSAIWPAFAMNLTALGFFGIAAVRNIRTGGIGFTMVVSVYTPTLLLVFGAFLTVGAHILFGNKRQPVRSAKMGLGAAAVLLGVLTFTDVGGSFFRDMMSDVVSSGSLAPWIPWFSIGPVKAGLLANFMIGLTIVGCLVGSVVAVGRYLTVVPWSDRFEHGYRVRPDAWNLAVILPFVILGWMMFVGIRIVDVGGFALSRSLLWIVIFLLPTFLTGAYLLRRQLEPYLQENVWQA